MAKKKPKASGDREERLGRCIGDVIQELLVAHENGRDVNLVIWHL